MDSRQKTPGRVEGGIGGRLRKFGGGAFDKICKGRKLNPRQKYQKWPPSLTPVPYISSDWWREQRWFWIFNESPLGPSTMSGLCMALSFNRKVLMHLFRCSCNSDFTHDLLISEWLPLIHNEAQVTIHHLSFGGINSTELQDVPKFH